MLFPLSKQDKPHTYTTCHETRFPFLHTAHLHLTSSQDIVCAAPRPHSFFTQHDHTHTHNPTLSSHRAVESPQPPATIRW
ncbi:hypothetical protein GQ44DRAFT_715364 [Phaeosphaeriaceae sp. PMI808]|nr:hypothetical protein GQ44DRAFT_715364 [Phaeosphaeriaceae sp. PMI808]